MRLAEVIPVLAVLLFCLVAGALAVQDLWRRARCRQCNTLAEIDDATERGWFPPAAMLVYRCPRCGRIIRRRFFGAWD